MRIFSRATAILTAFSFGSLLILPAIAQVGPKPHHWNENREVFFNRIESNFSTSFRNYYTGSKWEHIDLTFQVTPTGWKIQTAPYEFVAPKFANQVMSFRDTHRYSPVGKKFLTDAPLEIPRVFLGAAHVEGQLTTNGILYPGAFPDADLLLEPYITGVRYLLVFNEDPQCNGTLEYRFRQTIPQGFTPKHFDGRDISSTEEKISGSIIKKGHRKVAMPEGHIWDSTEEIREKVEIKGSYAGNFFFGKKVIDCDFFNQSLTYPVYTDDTSTFNPDADPESTTVDGYVWKDDSPVWATTRDAATGTAAGPGDNSMSVSTTVSTNYRIIRVVTGYDTSSIGAGRQVDSCFARSYIGGLANNDNDGDDFVVMLAMQETDMVSATDIATADYDVVGTVDGETELSARTDITGISTGAYHTINCNSNGIAHVDMEALTYIAWKEGHDIVDSPPTALNEYSIRQADWAGNQPPELSVTHSAAAASTDHQPIMILFGYLPFWKV